MSESIYGVLPGTTGMADPDMPGVAGSTGIAFGTGAGSHGLSPTDTTMNGNPVVALWQWVRAPITTPMTGADIFKVIGFVLIGVIVWNMILYHIRIAAEAI